MTVGRAIFLICWLLVITITTADIAMAMAKLALLLIIATEMLELHLIIVKGSSILNILKELLLVIILCKVCFTIVKVFRCLLMFPFF